MRNLKLKDKFLALGLSLLTAFSPVVSAIPVYSASRDDENTVESVVDTDKSDEAVTVDSVTDEGKDVTVTEVVSSKTFNLDLSSTNGEVIVVDDKGTEDKTDDVESHIRIGTDAEGKQKSIVTDKDGKLVHEAVVGTAENPFAFTAEKSTGSKLVVTAKADNGFDVATYSVTMDSGTTKEIKDFESHKFASFVYDVVCDADQILSVDFGKAKTTPVVSNKDAGIQTEAADIETGSEDTSEPVSVEKTDDKADVKVDEKTEDKAEVNVEEKTDVETEKKDGTEVVTEETQIETEQKNQDDVAVSEEKAETETEQVAEEHFLNDSMGVEPVDSYDVSDFTSMRLVLLTNDDTVIVDPEHVIGQYENIYLMQYTTPEQALNAYIYYLQHAEAVEPDQTVETADTSVPALLENGGDNLPDVEMTEEDNAVANAAEAEKAVESETSGDVIALIDTGVPVGDHVTDSVSVIDDKVSGGSHGDEMLKAILSQNDKANVLSIRAMNDKGYGTISSIVSAMEFAKNRGVKYINLSLYAKKSLTNSIMEAKINEVMDEGIIVAGAAGNAGSDVADYVPGCFDKPYIIGASDANGNRQAISNFGSTVDYYVVADSTSEATAMFTGYISAHGLDKLNEFDKLFNSVNEPTDVEVNVPEVTEAEADASQGDAYLESYVREHLDPDYIKNSDNGVAFVGYLRVCQALADANTVSSSVTLESLNHGDDRYSFIGAFFSNTALYNFDNDSDYYVTYANTMFDDDRAEIADMVVAANTDDGLTLKDEYWHYDESTGLLYVPKSAYMGTDGNFYYDSLQCEFLQKMYLDDSFKTASPVTVTVNDSEDIYNMGTAAKIYDYSSEIRIEKYLDADSLMVLVNGVPLEDNYYSYDPVSGILVLGVASPMVEHVMVTSDGRDVTQTSVAGQTSAQIAYLNDTEHRVRVNTAELEKRYIYKGTMDAWVHKNDLTGSAYGEIAYAFDEASLGSGHDSQDAAGVVLRFINGYEKTGSEVGELAPGTNKLIKMTENLGSGNRGKWTVNIKKVKGPGGSGNPVPYVNLQPGGAGNIVKVTSSIDPDYSASNPSIRWSDLAGDEVRLRTACVEYGTDADVHISNMLGAREDHIQKVFNGMFNEQHGISNSDDSPTWHNVQCLYRVLDYDINSNGNGWMTVGILGERRGGQGAYGVFKLYVETNNMYAYVQKSITSSMQSLTKLADGSRNPKYSMAGGVYELFTNSSCTTHAKDVSGNNVTFTLNADGKSSTVELPADSGTYYCKEKTAPTNYKKSNQIFPVTISAGSNNAPSKAAKISVSDDPVGDAPVIQKRDPKAGETVPVGNQNFLKARFEVTYDSDPGIKFTVKPGADGKVDLRNPDCYVSGLGGNGSYVDGPVVNLPVGSYTIKETVRPYGMQNDNLDKYTSKFTITQAGSGLADCNITVTQNTYFKNGADATLYNESFYLNVSIQKDDKELDTNTAQGDGSLAGIKFQITNESDQEVVINNQHYAKGAVITAFNNALTTNEKGYCDTTSVKWTDALGRECSGLPVGKYSIKEVATNDSYLLTDGQAHSFAIKQNGNDVAQFESEFVSLRNVAVDSEGKPTEVVSITSVDGGSRKTIKDNPERAGIKLQKFDNDNQSNLDEGNATLQGAEFTIINVSDNRTDGNSNNQGDILTPDKVKHVSAKVKYGISTTSNPGWDALNTVASQHADCVVGKITTNAEGVAQTANNFMPYGTYYVIETKAPTGYNIDKHFIGKVVVREDSRTLIELNGSQNAGGQTNSFVDIDTTKYDYFESGNTRADNTPKAVDDQVYRGDITLEKWDGTNGASVKKGIAQADASLKDVEFTIVNISNNADGGKVWDVGRKDNRVNDDHTTAKALGKNATYAQIKAYIESNPDCIVTTIKTDENGKAGTKDYALPYGDYYVIETKPSTGYLIDDHFVGYVEIRDDKVVVPLGQTVKGSSFKDIDNLKYNRTLTSMTTEADDTPSAVDEMVYRSGVSLEKADAENKVQDAQGIATLKGAKFAIINASQNYFDGQVWTIDAGTVFDSCADGNTKTTFADPNKPTWQELKNYITATPSSVVAEIVTDENGHAETEKWALPYGTYYVIETEASYGYYIDKNFVGKIVIRENEKMTPLDNNVTDTTNKKNTFVDLDGKVNEYHSIHTTTDSVGNVTSNLYTHDIEDTTPTFVDEPLRRTDLYMFKVNDDGQWRQYVPFLITALSYDEETGKYTELESHVMVTDEFGILSTAGMAGKTKSHEPSKYVSARPRTAETVNGLDKYFDRKTMSMKFDSVEEETRILQEAADWSVWFQEKDKITAMDDYDGALMPGYYRITELQCTANHDITEHLVSSKTWKLVNDNVSYVQLEANNAKLMEYYFRDGVLVDHEIKMETFAADVETAEGGRPADGSKIIGARESVDVSDTIRMENLLADHKFLMKTKFIDVTDDYKVVPIQGTTDADAAVSEDQQYVVKEFRSDKDATLAQTNDNHHEIIMYATLNTKKLNGHTLMAVNELYEWVAISDNEGTDGVWVPVKDHPAKEVVDGVVTDRPVIDPDECLYVPDLHTAAKDKITGDRAGARDKDDAILDHVKYENLAQNEPYTIRMTLVDSNTGEVLYKDADGNPLQVGIDTKTGMIWKAGKLVPINGEVDMKEFPIDSSDFKDNKSITVIESLFRADAETGEPLGEPLVVHDSQFDEEQTVRWIDISTSASDKNTADDVGTDEDVATVFDNVKLTNVVFDDDDHDGTYTYTVRGHLVYQRDFTDAAGVEHKEGDTVETLEGTQDVVVISATADGTATFLYPDGTSAVGQITASRHGKNVGHFVNPEDKANNEYIEDPRTLICDLEVEMIYKLNSNNLEGGTVVAFEYLYHDAENNTSTSQSDVEIAKHEEIHDKAQTVHYPKVRTSGVDNATKDDVGALREDATLTDTVELTNLVPGRTYTISGKLVEQTDGSDFLVDGKAVTASVDVTVTEDGKLDAGEAKTTVTEYNEEKNHVNGTVDLEFHFDASGLEDRTCVVFEDLYHNGVKVATHSDLKDKAQTVHFPKVRTTNTDEYTKDHVGSVREDAIINDDVKVWNLVPGREYTLKGVLLNKRTGEKLFEGDKPITAEATFVAGEAGDGLTWDEVNEDLNRVDGTVRVVFKFDSSLLEDTISVAFETLEHNGVEVATHHDLTDEAQTIHFPKIRTNAVDKTTGDEVGVVGKTVIRDTVSFWNLIPGLDYEISGQLFDKTTGEFVTDADGKPVTAINSFHINDDGTIDSGCCTPPCHCPGGTCTCEDYAVCVENIGHDPCDYVDGHANLRFDIDATELEGHDLVVYETLMHNGAEVVKHHDPNDLAQTIHMPKVETKAVDIDTNTNAGTVKKEAIVNDTVIYSNLVIGKEYTIKGTLMDQATGIPMLDEEGKPITAEATFTAATESTEAVNTVTAVNEEDNSVSGEYILSFAVDASQLAGKTVVVFEDLYHNDVKVDAHADLYDHPQSVHYPEIRTTATDKDTGDHVGSIWGALINGVRHLFGEKDADGNGIADSKQQNIVDTVELDNLYPGLTYVVSGKLYDKDASLAAGENKPLLIDGKEIVKAVTITVAEDGSSITAADGAATTVTSYDEKTGTVNGTVELVYALDSSKVAGTDIVVFETLYQDASYTPETDPTTVQEEDIIHKHENIEDENQTVSDVDITTTATDVQTGDHVGVVPQSDETAKVSVLSDKVVMAKLMPGMEYRIEGALVDIDASDFEAGKVVYLTPDGQETESREEAYKQTYTFTAENTEETHVLNFGLQSDKFMGRAVTVFEDLYHNDVKITSHPGNDGEGWNKEDFSAQTVYYPAGKTNATDNVTGMHAGNASATSVIRDRVYFEDLLVGKEYTIDGALMVKDDFTDKDGHAYKAGDVLEAEGAKASVTFTAAEDLKEASYVGKEGKAVVDELTVKEYPNGQKTISGYVTLEFAVSTEALAGQTIVAMETFSQDGVQLFVHKDLNDEPQMVRIPEISTNAKVADLDEASVYNADGSYADIEITDTVTYRNLWTAEQMKTLTEKAKAIHYADGTARTEEKDLYTVDENASYVLKGVLMDKETGEPLTNKDGKAYEVISDTFTVDSSDGSYDITFKVNAGDFVKETGTELEGKIAVAFEDLYMVTDKEQISDETLIAVHHDINDNEQDIRFPKLRTHLADGSAEVLLADHEGEAKSAHEVFATDKITITDSVSFENLHGGTKYTVTGTLQVVTEWDKNGEPAKWEEAKDDAGNVITQSVELDTSAYSKEFNDSVSGNVPLTFTFSGKNLEGKTVVAFEKMEREGVLVGVHADIKDAPQIVFVPKLRTHATELASGLQIANAGKDTVVIDEVTYENLEKGQTYQLSAELHKKSDGSAIESSRVTGTFVAGAENQVISADGTKVMTMEELKKAYKPAETADPAKGTVPTTETPSRNGSLDINEKKEYIIGQDMPAGYYKVTAGKSINVPDSDWLHGYWCIYYTKTGSVPTERTLSTTLANGVLNEDNPVTYIKVENNMVLQIAAGWDMKVEAVSETEAKDKLDSSLVYAYSQLNETDTPEVSQDTSAAVADEATASTDMTETGRDTKNVEKANATAEANAFNRVSGKVYVVMPIDATTLAGDTVVAFETLFAMNGDKPGKIIGEHADITDEAQSVYIPAVSTTATFADGQKAAGAAAQMTVSDTVTYKNLIPGQTYTVRGELFDKETGQSTGFTNTMEFKAEAADGSVVLEIPFDGHNLAGHSLVAFETVYVKGTDDADHVVATHYDINDEAQTVQITEPKITTNAKFKDGNKTADASKKMTVVDTVTYENLTPGVEYTLEGELFYKENSKTTGIKATATFTPKEANGSYDLSFTFDGSKLAGKQLVVFETLKAKDADGKDYIVAKHHDINDAAQTVTINPASKTKKVKSVDTGDVMNIGMMMGFVLSALMLAGVYGLRKKKYTV